MPTTESHSEEPITMEGGLRQVQQSASWEKRHGMTLIELLVVMSILGLLSVTVLPAFSNGESARAGRRAAAAVSSLVAQSQATALGRAAAAGLWIEPLSAVAAIDLSIAQRPEPYRGDTFTAIFSL
jgi:prepilin-type N-terminal cleavage/methylation domain-containing protein